jgi:hypothetical protein
MDFFKAAQVAGSFAQVVTAACCVWAVVNVYACSQGLESSLGARPRDELAVPSPDLPPPADLPPPSSDFTLERIDPPQLPRELWTPGQGLPPGVEERRPAPLRSLGDSD